MKSIYAELPPMEVAGTKLVGRVVFALLVLPVSGFLGSIRRNDERHPDAHIERAHHLVLVDHDAARLLLSRVRAEDLEPQRAALDDVLHFLDEAALDRLCLEHLARFGEY